MYYDLNLKLHDHRGQPITEQRPGTPENGGLDAEAVDLTLGSLLERACILGGKPGDDGDTKYAQYKLAQKLVADETALTIDEVARLKELCAATLTPIAYGAVVDALENPPPQPGESEEFPTDTVN